MSDKEDISIGSFINKHSSPLVRSYGIYHSHSDVFDMMKDYAESYHKHQMSKELEEAEKEIENNYMLEPGSDADFEIGEEYTHKEQGAKWLLNHLKNKIRDEK